jgi:GTP pyrophosphokinase
MKFEIKEIAEQWECDKSKFKELGKIIYEFIKSNISEYEILPEVSYRVKELLSIIKKIKKKTISKQDYSYNSLNDKLGFRIICSFQEDMNLVDSFLRKYFNILKVEYKQEDLNFKTLDYISNHYDITITDSVVGSNHNSVYDSIIFEVQVRTLNQHAWSNASHALSYKQYDTELPKKLNRRLYRLLSLYEIADDEISSVNNTLKNNPDNMLYSILRKLEGKIYKYAKIDFDRDTSLHTLKILLTYFSDSELAILLKEIEDFINLNKLKINRIFTENRCRFHEMTFLTQPEIFIIWFGLEKFTYSIEDNWNDDFDSFELEQIKLLWGSSIN